jgi:pyruvate,water dikinase
VLGGTVLDGLTEAVSALRAPLAVRSSAADEDVADKSAAGQYESVMGVAGFAAVRDAVEHCFRAADSERTRAYRGSDSNHVALVIQTEVPAQRAGIAFSVDPVSGTADAVIVEAVFGHGEGVVSGEVMPDRYFVGRDGGRISARVAEKLSCSDGRGGLEAIAPERRLARVMRDDELERVAALVATAERGFGAPVDVEFCWTGRELWLVQCRPITALRVAA